MNIQDIINNIASGENLVAKEGLENVLSAKAFDALQGYKQEIAATLYGGQEQGPEEDTDHEEDEEEGAYAEGVEQEDADQLNELSKETLQSYHTKAIKRRGEHESGRDVKVYKVGANTKGLARAKNRGVGKGPYESIEHDGNQLDEVSLDTAAKVYNKRADNAYSNQSDRNVNKQVSSRETIGKRFGLKGKQMAKSIEKKYDNYSK
jgi:hypothetical protein